MILVDHRAGSRELMKYFPTGTAEISRLQFGDAMWLGNGPLGAPVQVGVELKTLSDLLSCIIDGRYSGQQLPGMLRSYHASYLVLEGTYRCHQETGLLEVPVGRGWSLPIVGTKNWKYRDFECYLTTIETVAGVRIRHSHDRRNSAEIIAGLHHWWTDKEFDEHKSTSMFDVSGEPAIGPISLLRRVAKELPGVGWKRSAAVDRHFESILDMMLAGVEDWKRVDGIGRGIAKQVVEAIHRRKKKGLV